MSTDPKPRSRLQKASIQLAILAGFLVFVEIVARIVLWSPTSSVDTGTPRQGFSVAALGDWVPDQTAVWFDKLAYPYFVRINRDGFRNLSELDERTYKVLALGDSQTFGLLVSNHDVWPNLVERRLRSTVGRDVRVLNNGMSGSNVIDYLAYLREKGQRLKPDFILFAIYANDLEDIALWGERSLREDMRDHAADAARRFYRLRRWLNDHVAAYSMAREIKDHMALRVGIEEAGQRMKAKPISTVDRQGGTRDEPGMELSQRYRRLFGEVLQEVERLGARMAMIYLPEAKEVQPGMPRSAMFELARELALENRLAFLDLKPALQQFPPWHVWFDDPLGEKRDYPNDIHLTRFGHIEISVPVADFLEPMVAAGRNR